MHSLLDLPERMHGHVPVGLRDIGLPENEVNIRVLLAEIAKGIAQILDIVEGDSCDVVARDHVVESELTSSVISDKTMLVASRLGHCMNGHSLHSWQQIQSKWL